jgi:hypothetical protein
MSGPSTASTHNEPNASVGISGPPPTSSVATVHASSKVDAEAVGSADAEPIAVTSGVRTVAGADAPGAPQATSVVPSATPTARRAARTNEDMSTTSMGVVKPDRRTGWPPAHRGEPQSVRGFSR